MALTSIEDHWRPTENKRPMGAPGPVLFEEVHGPEFESVGFGVSPGLESWLTAV